MSREMIFDGGEYREPSSVEQGELARKQVLEDHIRKFKEFREVAEPADHAIAVEVRYYLQGLARAETSSLADAVEMLRERAGRSGISSALQALLLDASRRCRAADQFDVSSLVVKETDDGSEDDKDPITGPASLSVHSAPVKPVMQQSGLVGHQGAATVPKEAVRVIFTTEEERRTALATHDRSEREAARAGLHSRWEDSFQAAKMAAEHFIHNHTDLRGSLPRTLDALDHHTRSLESEWNMPPDVIGTEFTEQFFDAYLVALEGADDEITPFNSAVQDVVGLRCRIAAMEEALQRQTPEELLEISPEASRVEIEHAFAGRVQMLDFDRAEDRGEIAALQKARERLLVRAEAREREDAPRRAEEMRKAQEEAERAHYAWMTKPMILPEVQRQVPVQKPEVSDGILTKLARIPGRWIRGLVLSGTVFAAVGESAEHQKEFQSTQAAESLQSDQGGADVDQDKNTEGSVATRILPIEVPNTDHMTAPRETLWKVLTEKIRARGLRVTDEKIFTLKHYADLENPGIDWEKLQIGQVIHLKQVEDMLDQMEGKPAAASLPELEFQSTVADESESPLGNIPASIFEQGVARLQQQNAEEQARWYADLVAENHEPVAAKAYEDIPREGHAKHVMAKGEWIYKIIHLMLRKEGFNWSVARMNRLTNMTLQENGLSEEQAKRIPVGATISFDSAVREIQAMKVTKEKGKKI